MELWVLSCPNQNSFPLCKLKFVKLLLKCHSTCEQVLFSFLFGRRLLSVLIDNLYSSKSIPVLCIFFEMGTILPGQIFLSLHRSILLKRCQPLDKEFKVIGRIFNWLPAFVSSRCCSVRAGRWWIVRFFKTDELWKARECLFHERRLLSWSRKSNLPF